MTKFEFLKASVLEVFFYDQGLIGRDDHVIWPLSIGFVVDSKLTTNEEFVFI